VAALPPDSSALKDSEKDQKLLSYVLFWLFCLKYEISSSTSAAC
jgi:hypothetical protein